MSSREEPNVRVGTALLALAVLAAGAATPLRSGTGDLGLPATLAQYREWNQLLRSPYAVPMELWIRCMAPTAVDWARAREEYGPHTEHFIRVYGNQSATQAVSARERRAFPIGAVIAKEKFSSSPHGPAEGVAFMLKREASRFPETGGWEFVYYPASGDAGHTHEACAACHRAAASTDYVFGEYPR